MVMHFIVTLLLLFSHLDLCERLGTRRVTFRNRLITDNLGPSSMVFGTHIPELSNNLMTDYVLPMSRKVTNLIDCYRLCTETQECVYVSYQEGTNTCYLYSCLNNDKLDTNHQGWESYLHRDENTNCSTNSEYMFANCCNTFFKIYKGEFTYGQALAECARVGSHLIKIDSERKQTEVATHLLETGIHFAYIQGQRKGATANWNFDMGDEIEYSSWNEDQPMLNRTYNRLVMNGQSDGKWHTVPSTELHSYICEI